MPREHHVHPGHRPRRCCRCRAQRLHATAATRRAGCAGREHDRLPDGRPASRPAGGLRRLDGCGDRRTSPACARTSRSPRPCRATRPPFRSSTTRRRLTISRPSSRPAPDRLDRRAGLRLRRCRWPTTSSGSKASSSRRRDRRHPQRHDHVLGGPRDRRGQPGRRPHRPARDRRRLPRDAHRLGRGHDHVADQGGAARLDGRRHRHPRDGDEVPDARPTSWASSPPPRARSPSCRSSEAVANSVPVASRPGPGPRHRSRRHASCRRSASARRPSPRTTTGNILATPAIGGVPGGGQLRPRRVEDRPRRGAAPGRLAHCRDRPSVGLRRSERPAAAVDGPIHRAARRPGRLRGLRVTPLPEPIRIQTFAAAEGHRSPRAVRRSLRQPRQPHPPRASPECQARPRRMEARLGGRDQMKSSWAPSVISMKSLALMIASTPS